MLGQFPNGGFGYVADHGYVFCVLGGLFCPSVEQITTADNHREFANQIVRDHARRLMRPSFFSHPCGILPPPDLVSLSNVSARPAYPL